MKQTPTNLVMCSPAAVPTDGGFRPEADLKRKIPRVALLIESSRSYGRGVLRGVADYLKVYGPWSIFHEERSLGDVAPPRLIDCRPDGILPGRSPGTTDGLTLHRSPTGWQRMSCSWTRDVIDRSGIP